MAYATTQAKNASLRLLICPLPVTHNVMNTLGCTNGSRTAPTFGALAVEESRLEERPLNEKALRFALNATFPSYTKLTLIAMAHLGDENGVCETSFEALGTWCGQRPMYVKRGIALLMESGVIKALGLGVGRSSIRYQIVEI